MGTPLRLLILEDDPTDAKLALQELWSAGYEPMAERAKTEDEFLECLKAKPELILADFALLEFDSLRALEMLQERHLDIPFIVISSISGEERAALAMQRGASDYILRDRLGRLGPAVEHALSRWRMRLEKLKVEQNTARLAARHLDDLRKSEERYRNLVMALPAAIYTTDENGLITLFNEPAVELWGRRPELGKDRWCGAWKLFRLDGSELPLDQSPVAVALRDGRSMPGIELIYERPDGSRVHVLKHAKLLRGVATDVVGAVSMVVDITEMRQLEEQFRQSQKLDAAGQLAAGVAHDFNNLLTIIMGYSELFLESLPESDEEREPIEQIRGAGERAAKLTSQLLAFSRKQVLTPVVLDLNSLVAEMDSMLRRVIGEDVELCTVLRPDLGRVKADARQIEQVVMNLVVNARSAMPTGGRLTIHSHNINLTDLQCREHPDLPGGAYVLLTISDTGCGMDEATMSHIFEPFFTTKQSGKSTGTGLGLATVFGIVKQSGGFIEVESAVGAGTTFRIYLPHHRETPQLVSSGSDRPKLPRGMETILLVEDEDGLRKLVQSILESAGYKVLATRNGNEAVRVCYEYQNEIHLLFTDVVMPKMSGRQLIELLVPSRPQMKVLYMSGYTDDTIERHGVVEAGVSFLAKPFTPTELTQRVRDVLDAEPPRPPSVSVQQESPADLTAAVV